MTSKYVSGYEGNFNPSQSAVIPLNGTTTPAIDCGGFALCGIKFPATFTGATISFTMCDTAAGTFVPVKSTTSGTALSYTVTQATYAAIDPKDFLGIRFLKIVSASTESAARTLICSLKG